MSDLHIDPRFARRERQPGLDLLRALAIIVVVIYHGGIFGFTIPGRVDRFGWIGVDLFFVLSGYLIAGQLLAPLAQGQSIKLGRFYSRRALRIMPAYFAIVAIYFIFPARREFPEISPLWKFLVSVQNINLRGGTAFSHAWSLAIEDQFYLVLPFILMLICCWWRLGFIIPIVVFAGGLILRGLLAQFYSDQVGVSFRGFQKWIYYPTWTRLDPLVVGVVLAAIEKFRPRWWKSLINYARWLWLPAFALIAYGIYIGENGLTIASCIWQFPLIALGMAALLICSVSPRLPLPRIDVPGAAFFATIAYSVYLSHKLTIHAVMKLCSSYAIPLTSLSALLLLQVCIYAAGVVLFLGVERPFLQLRHRIAHRTGGCE